MPVLTLIITVIYTALFYLATAILVIGVGRKLLQYASTPAPLKIPTTPAPTTTAGVVLRMLREVVLFESLFKGCKWSWLFGWLFHFCLLLVLIRHLRYVTEPVWPLVERLSLSAVYVGGVMMFGLGGLLWRRIFVARVRYISAPSDYLMVLLIMAIGGSGLLMKHFGATNTVQLKAFMRGLMSFDWQPLPVDPILLLHLALVIALMMVFPISKLLHAPGIFFSPTLNQADNPRERRHLPSWGNGRK